MWVSVRPSRFHTKGQFQNPVVPGSQQVSAVSPAKVRKTGGQSAGQTTCLRGACPAGRLRHMSISHVGQPHSLPHRTRFGGQRGPVGNQAGGTGMSQTSWDKPSPRLWCLCLGPQGLRLEAPWDAGPCSEPFPVTDSTPQPLNRQELVEPSCPQEEKGQGHSQACVPARTSA